MEQAIVYHGLNSSQPRTSQRALLFILIAFGLLLSGYLFYRQDILKSNIASKTDVCSAVFGKGCDSALTSSVANQFGLSLAAWGIIYFVILSLLLLLPKFYGKFLTAATRPAVFILTLAACLGSISFIILMAVDSTLFCPLCLCIHIINLCIFFLAIPAQGYSYKPLSRGIKNICRSASVSFSGKNLKHKIAGFAFVLSVAVLLYFGLQTQAATADPESEAFNSQKNLALFLSESVREIPVKADDPVSGPSASPIQIIVFSDFQCPSCQYFSQVLNELKGKYADKFHVIYKHFPLGTACNPVINEDVHPRACEAATAAEAAKQQGKFWEFHDSLYRTNLNVVNKNLCQIATKLNLDHNKFEADRSSKASLAKIFETVKLADSLGITGTPAVFLNGRQVNNFSLESMETLIQYELSQIKN